MKVLYSFILFFNLYIIGAWAQCSLSVARDFGTNSPLLITNGYFVYPNRRIGVDLSFSSNQMQEVYCPDGIVEASGTQIGGGSLQLTCSSGSRFLAPTNVQEFSNIRCSREPVSSNRETGNCPNGLLIEIGFQITEDQFVRTIDLCYNSNRGRTYWAHSVIPGAIRARQTIGTPPALKLGSGGLFDEVPVVNAYKREFQRQKALNIFGQNTTLRDTYVSATGDHYLATGHLVPEADMFYTPQQYSTFYYLNVQPMYQSVNNGNWKLVEDNVRSIATNVGDLDVWTGNLYNLILFYTETENRELYLASNTLRSSPVLIVPRLFFKLVYSQSTNQAIVFITANNPFLTSSNLPNDYKICNEYAACRQNNPQFNNVDKGVTYCCLYQDFIRDGFASAIGLPALPNNVTPLL